MTGLPRMITDVLGSILERADDIELVGWGNGSNLSKLVCSTGAQVVVTGGGPGLTPSAQALFLEHPEVVLLAISADGRKAYRFRLVGEQERVCEVSPQDLLDMIREAAAPSLLDRWKRRGS